MASRGRLVLVLAPVALVAAVAACGGNVVIDPAKSSTSASTSSSTNACSSSSVGGAGGFGGGVVTPAQTSGGGASCLNLPTLTPCGGNGATTGSGVSECLFNFCEPGSSNAWLADCQGSTCVCSLNGNEVCTCAAVPAMDICAGGTTGCCFH